MTAHVPMTREALMEMASVSGAMTETERQLIAELLWQRNTTVALVRNMATNAARCEGCQAEIWWCLSGKTKRPMPITALGLNHFADCPNKEQFRPARERVR